MLYDHPDYDDHEHISFFHDEDSGLRSIVAIHSTAPFGISGGGCRFWSYADDRQALTDALRLSRAMSYKLALCEMPAGGAKSVIIGDPRRDKSEKLLLAMGRAVERLGGKYIIAEDVGTTEEDMRVIGRATKYVVGQHTDTGPATAYGAYLGLAEAARRALGREDLRGLRVAVQGLGNVGMRLSRHLSEAGAKLWVSDVNEASVQSAVTRLGATAVPAEQIYDAEVDVLAPCALGAILDDRTIPRLRCRLVAGAANNQLAEERHAAMLADRSIVYAPDFILNAGGVIGASQEGSQMGSGRTDVYDERVAFKQTEIIPKLLAAALERAGRESITPHAAAVAMAKDKIAARRKGAM